MGAPFNSGSWFGIDASYYSGMGGDEVLWLTLSIIMCVVSLVIGICHEKSSYRRSGD